MRLACNLSLMFTEVPLLERFQKAKYAGFDIVEIQFPYEESIQDLTKARQEADVAVCLINVPVGDLMLGGEGLASVPHKEQQFEEALNVCAEYANALEVETVNVLPGRCLTKEKESDYLVTLKQNLKKAAVFFETHNILCVFEAVNNKDMPHSLISNINQMLEVMRELQHSNLKMQYDIYHMHIMTSDVQNEIQKYWKDIGHIQFADVPGRGEPGSGLNLFFLQSSRQATWAMFLLNISLQ